MSASALRSAALALLGLVFSCAWGRAETWVAIGPTGGDVRSLAKDPRDARVVYLGTADGVLYRSDDAGGRWQRLAPGFPQRGMSLDDLVVGPDGTLFVGYWEVQGPGGGVARSGDGGRTFTVLQGMSGQGVRALAQAPGDSRVLAAGTLTGVFRSEDEGTSWRRVSPEGHPEIRNVNSVALDPRDHRAIYLGTWHLPWKTADAGATWHPVRTGMIADSDVMTLNLDLRDPETVFATACSGIYRSRNAGGQWSRLRGIPSSSRRTRAFAQDPGRPDTFYAGTTEGLWRSDDGSATWKRTTRGDLVVNAVLPLPGGVVLLGCDGAGVLRSVDDGRSFAAANEGFSSRFVARVVVDSGGRVFAGIGQDRRHGGVFTAKDTTSAFVPLPGGLEGRELLSLAVTGEGEDQAVLAGTDDGLFLYTLHCGFWRRLPTVVDGMDAHPRVVHLAAGPAPSGPKAPGTARLIAAGTAKGLLLSRDGGESWERIRLGLAAEVTGIALSDHGPVLVASTPLGLFRSHDLGRTFAHVSNGLSGAVIRGLAFLPGDPRVLFATTPIGLLRSEDQGATFARHGGGLPLSDVTGLAFGSDGSVYASDFPQGGVYRSTDRGVTWTPLPVEGLGGDRVWALAVERGRAGRLLAATAGGGLRELRPMGAAAKAAAGSK